MLISVTDSPLFAQCIPSVRHTKFMKTQVDGLEAPAKPSHGHFCFCFLASSLVRMILGCFGAAVLYPGPIGTNMPTCLW